MLHKSHRPNGCNQNYEAVIQMYVAKDGEAAVAENASVPAVRLDYGFSRVKSEKNWITFTYQDQPVRECITDLRLWYVVGIQNASRKH